ncbi:hypothetical protein PDE_09584 [Penicillium oxalicum 114-2]|uniref:Uncharacterized protein n=1 Tax=Penicillium oxalicum (strain 114-2 / CGMCC 5302) TaxID=933388 RepID=S7ZV47_PENO1|nr:hypothetical protein PDE_09584 [Penicillium oxalicum 114-2]
MCLAKQTDDENTSGQKARTELSASDEHPRRSSRDAIMKGGHVVRDVLDNREKSQQRPKLTGERNLNTSLAEMRSDQLWTTISRFYMEKRDVLLRDVGRLELEGLLTWKREESAREKTMALHADQMRSIPGGGGLRRLTRSPIWNAPPAGVWIMSAMQQARPGSWMDMECPLVSVAAAVSMRRPTHIEDVSGLDPTAGFLMNSTHLFKFEFRRTQIEIYIPKPANSDSTSSGISSYAKFASDMVRFSVPACP